MHWFVWDQSYSLAVVLPCLPHIQWAQKRTWILLNLAPFLDFFSRLLPLDLHQPVHKNPQIVAEPTDRLERLQEVANVDLLNLQHVRNPLARMQQVPHQSHLLPSGRNRVFQERAHQNQKLPGQQSQNYLHFAQRFLRSNCTQHDL